MLKFSATRTKNFNKMHRYSIFNYKMKLDCFKSLVLIVVIIFIQITASLQGMLKLLFLFL